MWRKELALELAGAHPRERRHVLDRYQEMVGFSDKSLYGIAKKHGFTSGKKPRADKGTLKSELTDRQIEFVAALMYETRRENKGPIMPVERAIMIGVMNGIMEEGQVTPSTMNRILRERQMSKACMNAATPHTPLRSLHPNHVHLFDVSVCIQYYLKNGKMGIMDERDFYKNKFENFAKIKTRMLRYVLVDHFSGAFVFKYFDTTGETQDNLWNFLKWAWRGLHHEKLPFRGVPFQLLMDTGAANKSKAIVNFLERLEIVIPKGNPYNPRRQGAVETTHKIIEEWFESSLRIQHATTIEDVNAWAMDMAAWYQGAQLHTRHGMARTACWLLIKPEQLRELPSDEILQMIYANDPLPRTVSGAYAISFQGKEYNLRHIAGIAKDVVVNVVLKPHKYPLIDVAYREQLYEAAPIEMLPAHLGGFRADAAIIGQTYRAQPETMTQKAVKRFDNAAYGEKKGKDAQPFAGLEVFGNMADRIGVDFITKKGTPIEIERGVMETQISVDELLKRLAQNVGRVHPETNLALRAQYGASIGIKEAEAVIMAIQEGTWPVQAREAITQVG